MKKIILFFLTFLFLTGCEKVDDKNSFLTVVADSNDFVIIDTTNITTTATFVNYKVEDTIIQLIVVRGTDGKVRVAFNTCQSCSPSPNAYFVQEGEYLECQNCKNKFHINQAGEANGGCSPALLEYTINDQNQIVIQKNNLDKYQSRFKNWKGPIS